MKTLLIDGTGLLFIKNSTDLAERIEGIKEKSGIQNIRIFMKKKINNQLNINKRYDVLDDLEQNYDLKTYTNMKGEIVKQFNADPDNIVVATLSGELLELLTGEHFDYYYRRMKYVKGRKK